MSIRIYYSFASNFMTNTVKVAAAFTGADYELVKIANEDKEEYKKNKNPTGLFPYMEVEDQGVSETNTILRYLARLYPDSGLYGSSVFQSAKVDEVLDVVLSVQTSMMPVFMAIFGYKLLTQAAFKVAADKLRDNIRKFETLLNGRDFFVGDSITIADLRVAGLLTYLFRIFLDPGLTKQIPTLLKNFERVTSDDRYRAVFGNVKIAKRPIKVTYVKEEKKKVAKQEEVKQVAKKEVKPTDELDALPPTTMELNAFKLWFINHPNREEAFEELVKERLDREGWSFWDMKYTKYKGEGEFLYKTNNLMDGFIQRAEHFAKYSYGVHQIIGEEPNLDIQGLWMWRGQKIPQPMIEHPQFEYYVTKKLDIDNPEDQARIKEMWCVRDGPFQDGTVIQRWKYQK